MLTPLPKVGLARNLAFTNCYHGCRNPCPRFLDVGCGEGRLGRFLMARQRLGWYTGVDMSAALLAIARTITMGDFYERDMSHSGFLQDLGQFQAIACLAAMQHIPGHVNRIQFLQELRAHLHDNGRIFSVELAIYEQHTTTAQSATLGNNRINR